MGLEYADLGHLHSQLVPMIPLYQPPESQDYRPVVHLACMYSGDLNSGPPTYKASILSTEIYPQP